MKNKKCYPFTKFRYCLKLILHHLYPQNETEDENKSKRPKIKTKRDLPQNEAYLRVRFFNRPPYHVYRSKIDPASPGSGLTPGAPPLQHSNYI